MRLLASPPSPASPGAYRVDADDVAFGTTAVPRTRPDYHRTATRVRSQYDGWNCSIYTEAGLLEDRLSGRRGRSRRLPGECEAGDEEVAGGAVLAGAPDADGRLS